MRYLFSAKKIKNIKNDTNAYCTGCYQSCDTGCYGCTGCAANCWNSCNGTYPYSYGK